MIHTEDEKISILIPTHKRPQYLRRAVEYWRGMDVNLFIADSTPQGNQNLNDMGNYYHLPKLNFPNKIHHVLKKIKTPFVALCADDDFISETGLFESIKYLEEHPDYVSAQGRYITFWFDGNKTIDYFPRYVGAKDKDVCHENAKERMKMSMSPFMHQIYAVHKTEILKNALKVSSDYYQPEGWELDASLVPSIFGKFQTLPVFYCAREAMEDAKTVGDFMTLEEWHSSQSYENELYVWRTAVAEIYSKQEETELAEGKSAFDDAIFAFFNQPGSDNLATNIRTKIKKYIPRIVLAFYRKIRYGDQTWPPHPNRARKLRREVRDEKGYPCSDKSAETEWLRMKEIIEKHGALDGITYREYTVNNE